MNSSKNARSVRFHKNGDPDVLQVENLDVPAPAPHEVRLQVRAIGINRMDTVIRMGLFPAPTAFPSMLGFEAAGSIEAVGSGVTNFRIGDNVNVIPAFMPNEYGTYGELINLPAYAIQRLPESLSFEQGAAVWCAYLVAYGMLVDSAKLKAGQAVLINAASSSAGLAAIQITNRLGGIAIALTTSTTKKQSLMNAGAKHVILTSEEDIAERVRSITNGCGAEVILDAVGGSQFEKLVSAAGEYAQIFAYGALGMDLGNYPTSQVAMKVLTIRGYTMSDLIMDTEKCTAATTFILNGLQSGELNPIIGKIFKLEEVAKAHRYLEENSQFGKVVLTV